VKIEIDLTVDPPPELIIEVEITASADPELSCLRKSSPPKYGDHRGDRICECSTPP